MADISKCTGGGCPIKEFCYRNTAEDDIDQTYFMHIPFVHNKDGSIACEFFWYNDEVRADSSNKDKVLSFLKANYGDGYKAGGSGHLGHISYDIILIQAISEEVILIGYKKYIESEFSTIVYTNIDQLRFVDDSLNSSHCLSSQMERIEDDLGFN